jgi:flavin-dependent dehydrogenase
MSAEQVDLVIVGLGTAGAAAAALCAERGLRVVGIERRSLGESGARWVNGVPRWVFEHCGLASPGPGEGHACGVPFHMLAQRGPERSVITGHDLMEVEMPALTHRLLSKAERHGALLLDQASEVKVQDGDVQARLGTSTSRWQAKMVVDASGLKGLKLLRGQQDPGPLCAAAQQKRALLDPQAAAAFFAAHGVPSDQTLCFTGVAGGYSILNVQLHGGKVSILAGSVPALGHPSGLKILEAFAAEQPWIGEQLDGGARVVPLGAPLACIGHGQQVALGDAAGMVFSAHGSGIGQQLLAAHLLAQSLSEGQSAWQFNRRWQRERAGSLCAMVAFRALSQSLSEEELRAMMSSGVMGESLSRATLVQQDPVPSASEAISAVQGLARMPSLAKRMVPVLARMQALKAHHKRYPKEPAGLPRWERQRRALFGGIT